ncbi:hypothetical protein KC19_11G116200 [Ceratodon purpureus]|uniref:Uncharacterized protein n=1 Tax=Ceratodon purpureus TaxID=3225 RepID=A0A8T0GFG2_CERPU|nr:hypothetical protein KC19_11G116200 [Ceratodon purpureus]
MKLQGSSCEFECSRSASLLTHTSRFHSLEFHSAFGSLRFNFLVLLGRFLVKPAYCFLLRLYRMLLPIALFFLSLGNTFGFSSDVKTKFLYATAFFSGLSILLQTGAGLVELYKSGFNFIQLLFSKLVSGILGPYGTDLLLSIGKYSTWSRSDLEASEIRGYFWRFLVYSMFYLSKLMNLCVFKDPYSGTFQVRYKSTAIWLTSARGRGENYNQLIEEAHIKISNRDSFQHSVKIRNTTMSLRWAPVALGTGRRLVQLVALDIENGFDSMVEVLLYSSQSNNYGGLFHHQFGPVATKKRYVVELIAMMEILAKDSFVVENTTDADEGHMHCISFEETMKRVLIKGQLLNFETHTGASYG